MELMTRAPPRCSGELTSAPLLVSAESMDSAAGEASGCSLAETPAESNSEPVFFPDPGDCSHTYPAIFGWHCSRFSFPKAIVCSLKRARRPSSSSA